MILWLLPEGIYKVTTKAWADELEGGNHHRMIEAGRDLLRSSSPTSCSSKVNQSMWPKTVSSQILNISMNRDSTASVSNLFKCLQRKKCLLAFTWNFNLSPLPFFPVTGYSWEEYGSFFILSHHVFIYKGKITLSLQCFRLESHLSQSLLIWKLLQPLNNPSDPVLDSF